jgi:uncharacterized protein (DUF952 family)
VRFRAYQTANGFVSFKSSRRVASVAEKLRIGRFSTTYSTGLQSLWAHARAQAAMEDHKSMNLDIFIHCQFSKSFGEGKKNLD